MKYISILKANEMEMEVLTDTADPKKSRSDTRIVGLP